MKVKVEGSYPTVERVSTGIYSMDVALGDPHTRQLGMPLRTYHEIYGDPHRGKSTLAYYLAAQVPGSKVSLCPIEEVDPKYIQRCLDAGGFEGTLKLIEGQETKKGKKVFRLQEDMLQEMVNDVMYTETCRVGIWDSIGAFVPIAEMEGDITDAIMGIRAREVGKVATRMSLITYKETPSVYFVVNHKHAVLGGRGHLTPGGKKLEYLAGVRVYIWNKEVIKTGDEIIGYLVGGTCEKLRWGGKGRQFQFIILPGMGVSKDLSAMFDCFLYGLARREKTVKIGDKSFGYISKIFEQARKGNVEKFAPFHDELKKFSRKEDFVE